MAQHKREADLEISDRPLLVVVQIRSADSHVLDPHQYLAL